MVSLGRLPFCLIDVEWEFTSWFISFTKASYRSCFFNSLENLSLIFELARSLVSCSQLWYEGGWLDYLYIGNRDSWWNRQKSPYFGSYYSSNYLDCYPSNFIGCYPSNLNYLAYSSYHAPTEESGSGSKLRWPSQAILFGVYYLTLSMNGLWRNNM